jgi:hypothetical protein
LRGSRSDSRTASLARDRSPRPGPPSAGPGLVPARHPEPWRPAGGRRGRRRLPRRSAGLRRVCWARVSAASRPPAHPDISGIASLRLAPLAQAEGANECRGLLSQHGNGRPRSAYRVGHSRWRGQSHPRKSRPVSSIAAARGLTYLSLDGRSQHGHRWASRHARTGLCSVAMLHPTKHAAHWLCVAGGKQRPGIFR